MRTAPSLHLFTVCAGTLLTAGALANPGQMTPAGTATPARAPDPARDGRMQDRDRDLTRAPDRKSATARDTMFGSWNDMESRNVYTDADKKLGDISDAVIDRGTGRIEFVAISLGMMSKNVLVPYEDLRWDAATKRLRLARSPEELKALAKFDRKSWQSVSSATAGMPSNLNEDDRIVAEALAKKAAIEELDPYQREAALKKELVNFDGTLVAYDRTSDAYNDSGQVTATFRNSEGKNETVILGPAWYVFSSPNVPARGAAVKVSAMRVKTRDGDRIVALQTNADGRTMVLRKPDGGVVWGNGAYASPAGSKEWGVFPSRYLLATDLVGANVECRSEKCGTVEQLIIEWSSGVVGFLSIDPDQKWLGIGETKRMVPFNIVALRADNVASIDATKAMVLSARETPKDLKVLDGADYRTALYKNFDVAPNGYNDRASWRRNGNRTPASGMTDGEGMRDNDRK